jgi:hypothetical protein
MAIMDEKTRLREATELGVKKGREQGLEQGKMKLQSQKQ